MRENEKLINDKSNELFRLLDNEMKKFWIQRFNKSYTEAEQGEIFVTTAANFLIYAMARSIKDNASRKLVLMSIVDRFDALFPEMTPETPELEKLNEEINK